MQGHSLYRSLRDLKPRTIDGVSGGISRWFSNGDTVMFVPLDRYRVECCILSAADGNLVVRYQFECRQNSEMAICLDPLSGTDTMVTLQLENDGKETIISASHTHAPGDHDHEHDQDNRIRPLAHDGTWHIPD